MTTTVSPETLPEEPEVAGAGAGVVFVAVSDVVAELPSVFAGFSPHARRVL